MAAMTPEWIAWIEENIARGVPSQTLIDTLLQHRFERGQAEREVLSRLPGHVPPAPAAEEPAQAGADDYQVESTALPPPTPSRSTARRSACS